MSKPLNKEEVIQHKKTAIKKINRMMESYINDSSEKHLKKANLLAYWLETFSDYIKREESYNPCMQISYKRGDIIKANFGFNVGKEYGGLHYAVVIDLKNDHNSHVVTVVPLTSGTEEKTHIKDVYLGTELFNKLNDKFESMLLKSEQKQAELHSLEETLRSSKELIEKLLNKEIEQNNGHISAEASNELRSKMISLRQTHDEHMQKLEELEQNIKKLRNSLHEIENLKPGSIALIGQITTIDKARIYTPRKSVDALYNISFSSEKMKLINDAIKKLYIFE